MRRLLLHTSGSYFSLPLHPCFLKRFKTYDCVTAATEASSSEVDRPSVSRWIYKESGAFETKEWRGLFFACEEQSSLTDPDNGEGRNSLCYSRPISPWHDLPRLLSPDPTFHSIHRNTTHAKSLKEKSESSSDFSRDEIVNFDQVVAVVEIPQGSFAKLEMSKELPYNPIVQDVHKKKEHQPLRYLMYEPEKGVPFHYGFIPRTFEDPRVVSTDTGCVGDGDPLDVVFLDPKGLMRGEESDVNIRSAAFNERLRGSAWRCKVLGVLPMIDEGETDWKVIVEPLRCLPLSPYSTIASRTSEAYSATTPERSKYQDISEVSQKVQDSLFHWFRYYKTCDGKPENSFAMNGKLQSAEFAAKIVQECALQYDRLACSKERDQEGIIGNYWF